MKVTQHLKNLVPCLVDQVMRHILNLHQLLLYQASYFTLRLWHRQLTTALNRQVELAFTLRHLLSRRHKSSSDGEARFWIFRDLSERFLRGDLPSSLLRKVVDLEFLLVLLEKSIRLFTRNFVFVFWLVVKFGVELGGELFGDCFSLCTIKINMKLFA